jgi:MFS family permease
MRAFIYILFVGAAVSFVAFSTSNPILAIAALFLSQMALTPSMTFGSSALQQFAPPPMRGRLSGLFISACSLMGLGVGPAVIGAVTEYVLGVKDHIGASLVIFTVVGQLLVAALLAWGLAPARRAIAEQAQIEANPAS